MNFDKGMASQKLLFLLYSVGILMIISLLSWGGYRFFLDNKLNQLAWTESELLSRSASVFSREMGHIKQVTLLLRNSIDARLNAQTAESNESLLSIGNSGSWEDQVADEFTKFATISNLISQVRWIMPNGQEHIRVNSQAGVITRVEGEQLQNKSNRGYVQNAPNNSHSVYISPLDLNIENQEVVRPFQPTVRGVVRLRDETPGLLVVNYDLAKLFELVRTFSNEQIDLEILDADGNWLLAADKSLEWGSILHADNSSFNIRSRYSFMWQEINASVGLERVFDDGRLWSVFKLYIDEGTDVTVTPTSALYFVARSKSDVFLSWRNKLILSIACVAVSSFLFITWLLWRQSSAQFETFRLLNMVQQEKTQTEQTNRKLSLTNKRLIDLQDELVETSKLSSLGLMVAGLAHEMHTPLGGVRMALSSCKIWLDKEAKERPSESLEKMDGSLLIAERNLARALDVVSSFKRIVSDRTAQDVQTFFFHNVVNDILFTYKPILKKRPDISLQVTCPEDIEMLGFPGALSQIIQNLMDNALDHGFQRLEKGVITLTAQSEKTNLILVIEDNGRGISPEIKGRIFEPFTTTGRTNQHTGLGLHLVNQWVNKLMNGRIEMTSEIGVGTRFILTIPLRQQIPHTSQTQSL
jgi:signal transduction histidine kinase